YIPPKEEHKNSAERAPEREESRGEEESFLISDTASLAVSDSLPLEGEEEKRSLRKEQGPGESGHSTASEKPEWQ
ncbi:MAG: hypothetical protein ACLVK6_06830, partial [Lachnospiraceae bacterium]